MATSGSAVNLQQTCRKPAANLQKTCRKPAANLQQTCFEPAANLRIAQNRLVMRAAS